MNKYVEICLSCLFLCLCSYGCDSYTQNRLEAIGDSAAAFASVEVLRAKALDGDAEAQFNLGCCYDNGEGVMAADKREAAKWFRMAAEQGHAKAQYNLGVCYGKGEGVAEDMSEAVKWFRKAAEQNDSNAQYNLGVFYYNGEGVDSDINAAEYWFSLSAGNGNERAKQALLKVEDMKLKLRKLKEAERALRDLD